MMISEQNLDKMKLVELREMASGLGIDAKNYVGKKGIITAIKDKLNIDGDFDQFFVPEEDMEKENKKEMVEKTVPSPINPEWTDYFLSHLADSELKNGNPTVDGIRRVCEVLYGEILASSSEVLDFPRTENSFNRCVVKHILAIKKYSNDEVVQIEGAVDVILSQLPQPYCQHLVASADTKAEGKALRRALKLNIVTAEEINIKEEDEVEVDLAINDSQIMAINQLCKRLDIDVKKIVKIGYNKEDIYGLSHAVARQLLHDLSGYQHKKSTIPADIIGYDPGWNKKG